MASFICNFSLKPLLSSAKQGKNCFLCRICKKTFKTKQGRDRHMENIHNPENSKNAKIIAQQIHPLITKRDKLMADLETTKSRN